MLVYYIFGTHQLQYCLYLRLNVAQRDFFYLRNFAEFIKVDFGNTAWCRPYAGGLVFKVSNTPLDTHRTVAPTSYEVMS